MSVTSPTLLIVAQDGRLTYEAVLFAASLRASAPDYGGKLIVAEATPGPLWPNDPSISDAEARALLLDLGAEIRPFQSNHFGASYPQGNKVEALSVLDPNEAFVFFDTDTIVTGPLDQVRFDTSHPSASMARSATWPEPPLYGPGYEDIWKSLYDRFGIPFETTLDTSRPADDWERYLYFNAGWFFGPDPQHFHARMIDIMTAIRDAAPDELASQALFPWLDQIALPLVIAEAGGGRPGPELSGLDGAMTRHWRALPLFYACASDPDIAFLETITSPNRIKRVLKRYDPFRKFLYQGRGARARALFDRNNMPEKEQTIRAKLKRARLWMR